MLRAAKVLNKFNFVFLIIFLVSCSIGLVTSGALAPAIVAAIENSQDIATTGFSNLGLVITISEIVFFGFFIAYCILGIVFSRKFDKKLATVKTKGEIIATAILVIIFGVEPFGTLAGIFALVTKSRVYEQER